MAKTIIKKLNRATMVVLTISFFGFVLTPSASAFFINWLAGKPVEIKNGQSLTNEGRDSHFVGIGNPGGSSLISNFDLKLGFIENEVRNQISLDLPAPKIIQELVVSSTAYSSTPDQTDSTPFITAANTVVRDGIVAANFLPFGTKIKIPDIFGDKIFTVEDRMNKRYWHRVDIWFPDRESALNFGHKTLKIQILGS